MFFSELVKNTGSFPLLLLGKPVGEILVVIESPGDNLGRLPELIFSHPSEFCRYGYSDSFTAVPDAVTMSMPLSAPRTS